MGVEAWSDLNPDVLFQVMMQLGVVDFFAFRGVCKSWRSLALSNMNKFIVSRPPMSTSFSTNANNNEKQCCLEDFERRKLKTIIPHSAGRTCKGVTCGYLILFGEKTHDFWLVNPITRHELHFPCVPDIFLCCSGKFKAILVFSPTISRWVFVVVRLCNFELWFSIEGKREWTEVPTTFCVVDLNAFKGKIYILFYNYDFGQVNYDYGQVNVCELRLHPEPKLVLLKTESFPKQYGSLWVFLSAGESLYVIDQVSNHSNMYVYELDFGKMKWVSKTEENYSLFCTRFMEGRTIKLREVWADFRSQYGRYFVSDKKDKVWMLYANMWYFFHDCLNAHLLRE